MPYAHTAAVPEWLAQMVETEIQRLGLERWDIWVGLGTKQELGWTKRKVIWAISRPLAQYKSAVILFYEGITKQDDALRTVRHELRHLNYARLELVLEQALSCRPRLTAKQASRIFRDAIELEIEEDCDLFARLALPKPKVGPGRNRG